MRKFRNLVIGGIENKVINLVLISILLVAGVFIASMLTQNNVLTSLSQETSERQLASVTGTTQGVIQTVIIQNMDRQTEMQAVITDELFHNRAVGVQMVGDYAQKLLTNMELVPPAPWQRPDTAYDGQLFVKALFADGLEEAAVADKLGVIANMTDLMLSVCGAYGTDNIWFTLPEGVTLMADTVPGNWIEEDGSFVPYDACSRYWYRQAVEAGKLVFSDVEYDFRTGRMCVTCSLPVYDADGALLGVAGADIFLDDMQQAIQKATESGGFLGVVNQSGHLIIAPMGNGVFQVMNSAEAADLRASEYEDVAELVRDGMKGKTDVRLVHTQDDTFYAICVPMKTVGWMLLAGYSQSEAELPVRQLEKDYQAIQLDAVTAYRSKSSAGKTQVWIIMIVLLMALLAGAILLGKRIVKPLNTITKRISELSETNLEFKMEDTFRTGDEVEELAQSFANISHKTVEYLDTVKRVTAEKERVSLELRLSHDIQVNMLPNIFPAFPERKEFDIYASMLPAKEVGGDFYDFYLADESHLVMVIADVSGKGIPAAMFMMASKIIINNISTLGVTDPAKILEAANRQITSNNPGEMFVTVWLGILDLNTGKLTASNAGHEYPFIMRKGGRFEMFKDRHGFVLGGMEESRYRTYELQLDAGDAIFVYTDGVAEATNDRDELFGTERLTEALNRAPNASCKELLGNVKSAVDAFVQEAPQFDDTTMLAVRYNGKA